MPHSTDGASPNAIKDEPMDQDGALQGMEEVSQENGTDKSPEVEDTTIKGNTPTEPLGDADGKKEVKLEDLFADVESDDEFPSSAAVQNTAASSPDQAPASPT